MSTDEVEFESLAIELLAEAGYCNIIEKFEITERIKSSAHEGMTILARSNDGRFALLSWAVGTCGHCGGTTTYDYKLDASDIEEFGTNEEQARRRFDDDKSKDW